MKLWAPTALAVTLLIGVAGCGLMDPEYKPNVTAYQNVIAQLKKEKQDVASENLALKAQIPSLQSAQAAKQTQLDAAKADLARAQATAGTPPEVVTGLTALVSSIQQEWAASKDALADTNALRAALAARQAQLSAAEAAKTEELKSYKLTAAADVGRSGITVAEALAGGGALTGVLALLKSFLGKSKAQPQVDKLEEKVTKLDQKGLTAADALWDRVAELERQNAALTGRLSLPLAPPPPTTPTA